MQGCTALQNLEQGRNATYLSPQAADEILDCIVDAITADINQELQKSKYISVLIDESTDITVSKKLIIYGKTVNDEMEPKTFFLGNVQIEEAHVNSTLLFTKVKHYLATRGIPMKQIYGFGSDGASLMTGKKTGVATQVKSDNPHCVSVHCFAHRLALCTQKAAESVHYIDKIFNKTMTDLFYYFKKSSCRVAELTKLQEVLGSECVRIKEVHQIRWFAFYDALFAVYKCWKPLVRYFKQIKKANEKESNLLTSLTDIRFVCTMHMLLDILPSYTQLSQLFQKQDLDISVVPAALESAINAAKLAKDGKGHFQRELSEKLVKKDSTLLYKDEKICNKDIKSAKQEFATVKASFVDKLIENTYKRFPKDSTGLGGCQV